jgi:hypothetical protein
MRLLVAFALLTTGLVYSSAAQSSAKSPTNQRVLERRAAHRAAQLRVATAAGAPASTNSRRAAIVVLGGAPVVEHLLATSPRSVHERMLSSEGDRYAQSLRQAKAPLVAQLEARGAMVVAQTEHVLNAIMVDATPEDLAWLRQQPGVQSAEFSAMRHVDLNAATTLIGPQRYGINWAVRATPDTSR